jgi:HD-GYP domain-containing protein (c-di-GMP phosphodiesterase class II)
MSLSAEARVAIDTFRRAVASAETAFRALRSDVAGSIERLEDVVESLIGHLKSSDSLLIPLLTGVTAPPRSAHAAVHVTILSLRIGLELRYSHPELSRLGQVAMLRDLGGSGRSPAGAGQDARGPHGPREARAQEIVEIVDLAATFVRLSREQPTGARAWPPAAVKETLRQARARVPDTILKALIQIAVSFPVGGLVRLNSGEIGCVVARNAGLPLRPVVSVRARRGSSSAASKLIDLQERPFLYVQEFLGYDDAQPGPAESPW